EYIRGTIEFTSRFYADQLPRDVHLDRLAFQPAATPQPIDDDDPRAEECNQTFGMDFANYTVGRLIPGRGNYQSDHLEYRAVLATIRGRVWDLGWRAEDFGDIDRRIRDDSWRRDNQPDRVERYGKKYGWIAYFEAAGVLAASGRLNELYLDPE